MSRQAIENQEWIWIGVSLSIIWNSWSKQSRNMFLYCSDNNKLYDYYTCHRKIHATNSNQTMLQVGAIQNILFRIFPIHIKRHIIFCHLMKFSPAFCCMWGEWWIDVVVIYCTKGMFYPFLCHYLLMVSII